MVGHTSFYTEEELQDLGFKSIGRYCKISRKTSFYGIENISIGNNVRIDDFCLLSGYITLGNNIHISAFAALYGARGIELEDYTCISPHSTILSATDDWSGNYLCGATHPDMFRNVTGGKVTMKKFSGVASHSLVFPKVTIAEGAVVGAMSMVKTDLEPWTIYAGVPVKKIKERSRDMLNYLESYLSIQNSF